MFCLSCRNLRVGKLVNNFKKMTHALSIHKQMSIISTFSCFLLSFFEELKCALVLSKIFQFKGVAFSNRYSTNETNVFKSGLSKFCGRQPLLSPLLNTLYQILIENLLSRVIVPFKESDFCLKKFLLWLVILYKKRLPLFLKQCML